MMDRLGWAAVGLFVAFKIAVLGSFAFEQVTGRAPAFGLSIVSPARAYQITTQQEHVICRTQDDLRLLSMIRDDRARVFEAEQDLQCEQPGCRDQGRERRGDKRCGRW